MAWENSAQWFEARRAQNRKPATYRCPLCGQQLPALMEHVLLFPEGDHSRRRHAHTACVLAARKAGRLPTKDEWQRRSRRTAAPEDEARGGFPAAFRRVLRGRRGGSPPA